MSKGGPSGGAACEGAKRGSMCDECSEWGAPEVRVRRAGGPSVARERSEGVGEGTQ